MLRFSWCLVLCGLFSGWTQAEVLVGVGEQWRYFKGTEPPTASANAWAQTAFDDSGWAEAPSGFSYGYGSFNEATVLSDMRGGYTSVYLRKSFTVPEPDTIRWLILRMHYSDGFVAYLNGTEVARRQLGEPGTPVGHDQTAAFHPRDVADEIHLSAYNHLLRDGENVLAIQAHNDAIDSFTFDLLPELLANFNRGPFLQNASTDSVQVIWKTPVPATSRVRFGVDDKLTHLVQTSEFSTNHVMTLTNLAPDTPYTYQVESSREELTAVSKPERFSTLKKNGPITFSVIGDTGEGSLPQYRVARVLESLDPDLVLHCGDVVYPYFKVFRADSKCFSVYHSQMRSTPFYFTLGNHDLSPGPKDFLASFYSPTNDVAMATHEAAGTSPEHYFSFDHGEAHFVGVFAPFFTQHIPQVGDPQYTWLENDLAASHKPWKFLFLHHTMKSSGLHRNDDLNLNGIPDNQDLLEVFLPLARKYGVQVIFTGHDHHYERFRPLDGVHLVVSAGGGRSLYPFRKRDPDSAQFYRRYHCLFASLTGNSLRFRVVDAHGQVFDQWSVYRKSDPAASYHANWHRPRIESVPANDGDGNVIGQEFDLVGSPIPTQRGQSSNIGEVYVNYDRTHLYLGVAHSMLGPDQNLFLFVELPGQPGVDRMTGLGNGLVDPDGQGVDGLDFLENLAFTNFTPRIACVLGDERADTQARSFQRQNMSLNTGQGIFFLDAELSDVPGVKLQQFNRSPQVESVPDESDADYMEAAIPLEALGEVQPGENIKIGALVGGPQFHPELQVRELDSAFLGRHLHDTDTNQVLLEGVPVQLAADPDDADGDGLSNRRESELDTDPQLSDTDGDGLGDAWEVAFGLDPGSATGHDGTEGDPDADGLTNRQEHEAGTDPLRAGSVLRLELERGENGRHRFIWPAVIGKKYQLEFAEEPMGDFQVWESAVFPIEADTEVEGYEVDLSEISDQSRELFYRLRIVP